MLHGVRENVAEDTEDERRASRKERWMKDIEQIPPAIVKAICRVQASIEAESKKDAA